MHSRKAKGASSRTILVTLLPWLLVLGSSGRLGAQEKPLDLKARLETAASQSFWKALDSQPGFSFKYGNQTIGPSIPAGWTTHEVALGPGKKQVIIQEPDGLQVIWETTEYDEYQSVEYTLQFKNMSSRNLAPLTDLKSVDLAFGTKNLGDPVIYSSGGGTPDSYYPPEAFTIHQRVLAADFYPTQLVLETQGGRSSNKDLPFMALEDPQNSGGVYLALGWSGQWRLTVDRIPGSRTLRISGGMPDVDLSLEPGEEITSPRILVGFYAGEFAEGCNQLRRLLYSRFTPEVAGKKPLPLAVYDSWWGAESAVNENLSRARAEAAGKLGQEYFLQEPGWYADSGIETWYQNVGNWAQENRVNFPAGVKTFSDYVRSQGLNFGLWLEPERAWKGTLLAQSHPDWVTFLPGDDNGLVDFGLPAVREWAKNLFNEKIREYDAKYIRWDFNVDPLPYWELRDQARPHRKGISQIRHIEGLYEVADWVRDHNPSVTLEGCASGGRRIDLESLRRFHVFWISDETISPQIVRHHLHGAHYFLPGNYLYRVFAEQLQSSSKQFPDIDYQSFMGGAFGLGGRVETWTPEMIGQARRHVEVYKSLRHFLLEDYYPLFAQPQTLDAWDGAQYHAPKTQDGFVLVYRLDSPLSTVELKLHGLEASATYEFSDPYTHQSFKQKGSQKITIQLDRMTARVLAYKRI
jgi:alpha-galactosidase